MQLIQLSEPAAVDIKKTMSSLEEPLETSQINGALGDIEQDCAIHNISLNKKDTISKSDEEITLSSAQITNFGNKIRDLNGIAKTNGDTKHDDKQRNEEETEVCEDNIENGSPVNNKSNGNSTLIEACSPTSLLDINNTEKRKNISVEKNDEDLELEGDVQEIEDVTTGDLEITDDSSNSKLITDDVSIDKNEKASDTDKLDDIEIPEETKDVSTFLTNSDININSSEQILQLEDDDSMEDTGNTHDNNKPTSPIMDNVDEMLESTTDHKENTGINKIEELDEKDIVDSSNMQTNKDPQPATEKQPIDAIVDKLENCIDHSTEKKTEDEEDCLVAIDKQLLEDDENNSGSYIIMNNMNPVSTEETLDSSNKAVDETPTDQKCIKIRNFSDMVENVVSVNEAVESNEVPADLIEKQLKEKCQTQDEVMDVDMSDDISLVTPENNNGLKDVPDQLPLIQGSEIENNDEMVEKNITKDKPEENKSEISEEKQLSITEITDNDDVVMEVDDDIMVSDVDKTIPETTIVDTESQNFSETKEPSKQDAVINIIDKENEDSNNSKLANSEINNDKTSEAVSIDDSVNDCNIKESKELPSEANKDVEVDKNSENSQVIEKKIEKPLPVVCKLSNTMDILSDDEDEPLNNKPSEEEQKENKELKKGVQDNKSFNIDDDDDIMFIEDSQDANVKPTDKNVEMETQTVKTTSEIEPETGVTEENITTNKDDLPKSTEKCDSTSIETASQPKEEETKVETSEVKETITPIITKSFLKTVTKNLADMTRNELEDFCILKLVESVVDKSNLNEIKSKMKTMTQTIEELRKKTLALTKQNRDLQVVVKTVQEDQKKRNSNPMMPMKITRSVGMQVVLNSADKSILKKKLTTPLPPPTTPVRPVRNVQSPKTQKPAANNIPVPRLVPASSPTIKAAATPPSATKTVPNARNTTPQRAEKRPLSKSSPGSSVTVDLTDDEPPAKVNVKNPTPPVRLVPSQNLMPAKTRPQFGPTNNSPRKVYIPISSNNPNIRPPPAVIKNFVPSQRPRQPGMVRMQTIRMNQVPSSNRHPAPLPDAMKQYQPPTWKALPPAPDLKLSKVDNGIVISWKFEGYQPDSYEEVASFQLYAYQETPAPPSTALWKKIGDIKALPLPMACTLTQFMSGFKYYFAVRAIDVRSRIGPFSLPGSIMLISKS